MLAMKESVMYVWMLLTKVQKSSYWWRQTKVYRQTDRQTDRPPNHPGGVTLTLRKNRLLLQPMRKHWRRRQTGPTVFWDRRGWWFKITTFLLNIFNRGVNSFMCELNNSRSESKISLYRCSLQNKEKYQTTFLVPIWLGIQFRFTFISLHRCSL